MGKLLKISKKTSAVIVIIIIAAVVILINLFTPNTYLILRNNNTGEVYAQYPLKEGENFEVGFIHSVNQRPLVDKYEIRNDEIYVVETIYYQFGAGVQTEIEPGQTLTYGEDGSMIVSGIDTKIPYLSYAVGIWSDHTLIVNGGKEISLRELCGRGSLVHFSFEKKYLVFEKEGGL